MNKQELVEYLAKAEHESWARWMTYLFEKCEEYDAGDGYELLGIPRELVTHWKRQIDTPYKDLSEQEKQSDRNEVTHILPFIDAYKDDAISGCDSSGEMAAMAWGMANANSACISDLQRQVKLLMDEVFCTYIDQSVNSNKTLLGHVNNLYRLIHSLQEKDSEEVTG